MAAGTFRVGIVGVGNNAAVHHVPAYWQLPQVDLVACCGTSLPRAQFGAQRPGIPNPYDNVGTMIRAEGLDAVSICSPNDAHYQNTLDAPDAGAHVLCEKPLALNRQQAREMCDAATRMDRQTMVAYTYRFVPAAKMAKEVIATGELGDLFTFQATYVSAYLADLSVPVEKPWKLMGDKGGGVLGDLGSHLIDLTRWWFGAITRVGGVKKTLGPRRALADGSTLPVDVDDLCAFTAEFASGLTGSYFVTKYATGRANCQRVEVYGSRGALAYSVERPGELDVCLGPAARDARQWSILAVPDRFGNPGMFGRLEAYRLERAHSFVHGVMSRTLVAPTFSDGWACQQVLDAVAQAAVAPAWVRVEP
jgi:predicted dehydrogenase